MAVRDKSQSVAFLYQNVYDLYKKSQAEKKEDNAEAEASGSVAIERKPSYRVNVTSGGIIKAEAIEDAKVSSFEPKVLKGKGAQSRSLKSLNKLKADVENLTKMHSRLRFMLKELEDMVNKK